MEDECELCGIFNNRENKLHVVLETKNIAIIEAKYNVANKHYVVVSKKHEYQNEILLKTHIFKEINENINKLLPSGWRMIINVGRDSHQKEEHAHIHIIGGEMLTSTGGY